jgi:ATP-dependent exoDNAse (exonuclease V) beta subunit
MPDVTAQADALQILTIHKAKGLEFDTVILPGLGGAPRRRDPSLFLWMERPARGSAVEPSAMSSRLLLAPFREGGAPRDPIYDYIVQLDREKESHENARLLYVAATRARKRLHLLGATKLAFEGAQSALKRPGAGSLLEKLWPVVSDTFEARAGQAPPLPRADDAARERGIDQALRRLAPGWAYPALPRTVSWDEPRPVLPERVDIEFSWVGEVARRVGTVVHRWLQRIAEDGLDSWNRARLESMLPVFRRQLAGLGMDESTLAEAAERVSGALRLAVEERRGRWLLGPQREARNEYRLCVLVGGELRHVAVDRVFLDEQGIRWIIDYKTSSHEGGDTAAFLDRERERYRAQLERYREAMAGMAPDSAREPTRLGLYFPLLSGWREWGDGD